MPRATFRITRGSGESAAFKDYSTEVTEGMVVLDAVHRAGGVRAGPGVPMELQGGEVRLVLGGDQRQAAADVHDAAERPRPLDAGHDRTAAGVPAREGSGNRRLVELPCEEADQALQTAQAGRAGRHVADAASGCGSRAGVPQVHRVLPVRDVCHVLRDHHKHEEFAGPRHFVYAAALEMHPLDVEDRVGDLRDKDGIGYCNITKCCTKVCPEHITITDNAIIPLKERVVDEFYDPLTRLFRIFRPRKPDTGA